MSRRKRPCEPSPQSGKRITMGEKVREYVHSSQLLVTPVAPAAPATSGWGLEISPVESTRRIQVSVFGRKISVTITCEAGVVDEWVSNQSGGVYGVDLEWKPNFIKGEDENKVALVQVCGEKECLIIQTLFLDRIPSKFLKFLNDPEMKLGGIGIGRDASKLMRDFQWKCRGLVELGGLAAQTLRREDLRNAGLKRLALAIMGLRMEKPKRVTMSNWAKRELDRNQDFSVRFLQGHPEEMVLLHLKQAEDRHFLFEAPAAECVDTVIRDLVMVSNLQARIQHLVQECRQLASHGPAKQLGDEEGESDEEDVSSSSSSSKKKKERGAFYNKDASGRRTGEACDPALAETLRKTLLDAEQSISKNQVLYKVPLTATMLKEMIQNIKGAVTICYPMGLPRYDPVQQELNGTFESKDAINPVSAQLWWAGKELMRDKRLSDYVGKNDKTKIIARLQDKGRGAPQREPPVDEETQKAMMSWYYKRQQENKVNANA